MEKGTTPSTRRHVRRHHKLEGRRDRISDRILDRMPVGEKYTPPPHAAAGVLEDGVVVCILMTSDNDWAGRGEGELLARPRELGPELGEVRVDHLLGEGLEGDLGRPAQELHGLRAVADEQIDLRRAEVLRVDLDEDAAGSCLLYTSPGPRD